MKTIFIILLSLLSYEVLFSRPNLVLKSNTHKLEIYADTALYGRTKIYNINIYDRQGKFITRIKPQYGKGFNYSYGGISEDSFTFKDLNRDSIDDIIFIKNQSDNFVSRNQFCYLSNNITKSFDELIGFDTIPDISYSQLPRIIPETYEFEICGRNSLSEYEIIENKLYPVLKKNNVDIQDTNKIQSKKIELNNISSFVTKNFINEYYNYQFVFDSTNKDDYSEIYLRVLDKSNIILLDTNLISNNIYYAKWLFDEEDFLKNFIQEIDLNNDKKQDIIITGGNWPSTIKVWIYSKRLNRLIGNRDFISPVNILTDNNKIKYTVAIPCGTGYPTINKHIFTIHDEDFHLLEIEQKVSIEISESRVLVIKRTIKCNGLNPKIVKEKRQILTYEDYIKTKFE